MTTPTRQQINNYQDLIDDLIIESDEEYHSKRSENVTSSSLKDFNKSPLLYYQKHIKGELTSEETEALYMGTLTHTVVLEGPRKAKSDYSFDAPINSKGNEYGFISNKFQEARSVTLITKGKKLARLEDYDKALEMRMAVNHHPIAMNLLSLGQAERVVRMNYHGLPVQIKMDLITPYGIIDLKTVKDIEDFHTTSDYCHIYKYGYLISAAFYRAILHHFKPEIPKQDFYFVVVEKKAPNTVGVWQVANDVLDDYELRVITLLEKLKDAKEFDQWPNPYEQLRTIEI